MHGNDRSRVSIRDWLASTFSAERKISVLNRNLGELIDMVPYGLQLTWCPTPGLKQVLPNSIWLCLRQLSQTHGSIISILIHVLMISPVMETLQLGLASPDQPRPACFCWSRNGTSYYGFPWPRLALTGCLAWQSSLAWLGLAWPR